MPSYRLQELFHDLREGVPRLEVEKELTDPAGNVITGSIVNNLPMSAAHPDTNTSVPDGTMTKIPLDTVVDDELGIVDTANNRMEIADDGRYLITFGAGYGIGGSVDAWCLSQPMVNGSHIGTQDGVISQGGSLAEYYPKSNGANVRELVAGDTVELFGYNQSAGGSSINVSGGSIVTSLRVVRLDA